MTKIKKVGSLLLNVLKTIWLVLCAVVLITGTILMVIPDKIFTKRAKSKRKSAESEADNI